MKHKLKVFIEHVIERLSFFKFFQPFIIFQVEPHILGACASDRSIILYDIRLATPMRKVIMELSTNAIAWNPMEAPTFIGKAIFYFKISPTDGDHLFIT